MNLNEQQKAVVEAIDGSYVVIAGPGSGKTASMIERYLNMIIKGIPQKDILNLTFTSAAATEMVRRVGLCNAEQVFRTFHSFALELMKNERRYVPFKMTDQVIPVRGEDYQLLFDLCREYPIPNFRILQGRLSEWKRCNIEPEQAIKEAVGKDYFIAQAYGDYEARCREQGWLDFDSLMREAVKLLETNAEVRARNKRKYLSVDECQDTDITQFRLLQLLFGGNILVVGDENQCQPPGTLVDVLVRPQIGRTKAHIESVPIEELSETHDRLVSWDSHSKRVRLGRGRYFRRAVRQFDGDLLIVHSNNKITGMTRNHFVWTKFNREGLKKKTHFVYLMWKRNLGFRVGTSTLRTARGSNQISHRGYQEKADRMWILEMTESGTEARTREEIYSLKYQIPEHTYQSNILSKSEIWRIFNCVSESGGFKLLKDSGLLFDYPLVSWEKSKKYLTKFHGYFKTVAANLIKGLMDLPTEQSYKSAVIEKIEQNEYHGPVYSLNVEKDHTYIADGIPIGNCIYEWRSAQPGNLTNFSRQFPGSQTLYLGRNYRSTGRLVSFYKSIIPVDNGLASHMTTTNPDGVDPVFIKYPNTDIEVRKVLQATAKDPENSVIIARTNRQLFNVQRIASQIGIPYKNLGKKDFWEQNEIKALLNLAKDVNQFKPATEALRGICETTDRWGRDMFQKYANTGDLMNSDPAENLRNVIKMASGRGTLAEFLGYVNRLTKARKSRKEKDLMLATVHQAKGREWKNVFVIGAEQGLMPHKEGELAEEKRIFFVACSRAAESLQISWSGSRSMFLEQYVNQIQVHQPENVSESETSEKV